MKNEVVDLMPKLEERKYREITQSVSHCDFTELVDNIFEMRQLNKRVCELINMLSRDRWPNGEYNFIKELPRFEKLEYDLLEAQMAIEIIATEQDLLLPNGWVNNEK